MKLNVSANISHPSGFSLDARFDCDAAALGITGPSGSGKTTLLNAIAGLVQGANVVFDGADFTTLPTRDRSVGYVTQDALLFPHLTVRGNLLYGKRAEFMPDIVDALGIGHLLDRMPRNLSGGEKRRVSLARAIMSRPRVLLLDEPFSGLDETLRREAMSMLCHLRQTLSIPIVLVSHAADELTSLTDWTVRIENGRVVAGGASAAVLRAHETRIDNFFTGTACGAGRVRAGAVELTAMLPDTATGSVRLACYAHDILLATVAPVGISARNVIPVTVASSVQAGGARLISFESFPLRALLTNDAAQELNIKEGSKAFAIIKATSIVYLGAA